MEMRFFFVKYCEAQQGAQLKRSSTTQLTQRTQDNDCLLSEAYQYVRMLRLTANNCFHLLVLWSVRCPVVLKIFAEKVFECIYIVPRREFVHQFFSVLNLFFANFVETFKFIFIISKWINQPTLAIADNY